MLRLEEVDVLAASLTDGLEPGFSRQSGPPSEASPGDLSELCRETYGAYDCLLQVTIMLEHIPKTKDELPLDCRSWVTAGRDAFWMQSEAEASGDGCAGSFADGRFRRIARCRPGRGRSRSGGTHALAGVAAPLASFVLLYVPAL